MATRAQGNPSIHDPIRLPRIPRKPRVQSEEGPQGPPRMHLREEMEEAREPVRSRFIGPCVFCQYTGEDRTYRPVPIPHHKQDHLCNLCDTKRGLGDESSTVAGDVLPRRDERAKKAAQGRGQGQKRSYTSRTDQKASSRKVRV